MTTEKELFLVSEFVGLVVPAVVSLVLLLIAYAATGVSIRRDRPLVKGSLYVYGVTAIACFVVVWSQRYSLSEPVEKIKWFFLS